MKKKIFIVQYTDTVNSRPEMTLYKVEATTKKSAVKKAYEQHNPDHNDVLDDAGNESIKEDFMDNAEVLLVITAPIQMKAIKIYK